MLTSRANDYYLDLVRFMNLSFDYMKASVKRRFITSQYERTQVRKWVILTFNEKMAEKDREPRNCCLELLVSRMHELRSSFLEAYGNGEVFRKKLLSVVKDVAACKIAYQRPTESAEGLKVDIRSSWVVVTTPRNPAVDAHFLDHLYHVEHGPQASAYGGDGNKLHKSRGSCNNLRCIVCHKKGYWIPTTLKRSVS